MRALWLVSEHDLRCDQCYVADPDRVVETVAAEDRRSVTYEQESNTVIRRWFDTATRDPGQ